MFEGQFLFVHSRFILYVIHSIFQHMYNLNSIIDQLIFWYLAVLESNALCLLMADVCDCDAKNKFFGQDNIQFHCLLFVIGHNMKILIKLLVSASTKMDPKSNRFVYE